MDISFEEDGHLPKLLRVKEGRIKGNFGMDINGHAEFFDLAKREVIRYFDWPIGSLHWTVMWYKICRAGTSK